MKVEIDLDELAKLRAENARLSLQVTELQEANTKLVLKEREESISTHLHEFGFKFGYPTNLYQVQNEVDPTVIGFRAFLHLEESFETLAGMYSVHKQEIVSFRRDLQTWFAAREPTPNYLEIADGLGDCDYINEGTRQVFGFPRVAIAMEIQRANMEKDLSKDGSGKPIKPAGWRGPDIRGILLRHGLKPELNF